MAQSAGDALAKAMASALANSSRGAPDTSALALIQTAETGARPVLASASDGNNYWLKWPGNPHGNLSLAHEMIVAKIGGLIGAPVRPAKLVLVDGALTAGEYVDGVALPAGIYSGSKVLSNVEEQTSIEHVTHDGNPRRFAFYLALWDLCLGSDLQLLYDRAGQDQVWSIDHGLWFDSHEGDWSGPHLASRGTDAWPWPGESRPRGLDGAALHEAADRLVGVSEQSLAQAMSAVPVQWGVSDQQLTILAAFVNGRRASVAQRLRAAATRY